ncbi:MAG: DUF6600 domain-containing protein [Verrucomicrobiota bacterium]
MKSPRLPSIASLTLLAALSLTGCKEGKPTLTPEQQEQEVEKRVKQKLAEERLAQQQQSLDQKAQDLATREQQLAQREQQAAATPTPAADQEPPAASEGRSAVRGIAVDEPATSRPPGSYDVFYNALDRDGDWFEVPRYGLVWRPAVSAADPGWRPYSVGHWAYTEQGWTWISDEPFGWATYHYGRWTRLVGTGWVWVPGDQWAPAWVSWRNNDNYVGWAPLPPESAASVTIREGADSDYNIAPSFYSFVAMDSFGNRELAPEIVAPEKNVMFINQTRNVTNVFVNNTVVINQGPSIEVVQRRTRQHIDILKIARKADLPPGEAHTVRGNVLEVKAPLIEHGRAPQHRPATQRRVELAEVDRSTPPPARVNEQRPVGSPAKAGHTPQNVGSPHPQTNAWTAPQRPQSAGSAQPQSTPQSTPPMPSRPTSQASPVPVHRPGVNQPFSPTPARPATTPWVTPTPVSSPTVAPTPVARQTGLQQPVNQPANPIRQPSSWGQSPQSPRSTAPEAQSQPQEQRTQRPAPPIQRSVQPEPARQVQSLATPRPEPPRRPEPPAPRIVEPERRAEPHRAVEPARSTPAPSSSSSSQDSDKDKDKHDKKDRNR